MAAVPMHDVSLWIASWYPLRRVAAAGGECRPAFGKEVERWTVSDRCLHPVLQG